ncbi:MAG: hypothetical protein AAFZ58_04625 [Pseudomonadota bacterium]
MTDERDIDGDEKLMALLSEVSPGTSEAHDAAVLNAARRVAEQRRRSKRRGLPGWLVGLATALPAVALGLFVFTRFDAGDDLSGGNIRGQVSDVVPLDGGAVAGTPQLLRWTAVPGAERYRVTIRDDSALPRWSSEWQNDTEISLDAAGAPSLEPGLYLWTVEAVNGRQSELGPYTFRVEAR